MPDWNRILRDRLAPLGLTPTAEADLARELADHLELRYTELRSGDASESDAQAQALAELDNLAPFRAAAPRRQRLPKHDPPPAGDSTRGSFFADLRRDLRYALRSMRKNPLFVAFVVLTLALGIGANTTVFTVINTLILNPIPARDPAALASVAAVDSKGAAASSGAILPVSYQDLRDYRDRADSFQSFAGYTGPRLVTWQEGTSIQRLFAELATASYFDTLGLTPARGRFFLPDEDALDADHAVAVVSYGSWQRHFGADPAILGRTLKLNNVAITIVGVAPPSFIGINGIFGPDFWVPAAMAERLFPDEMRNALHDRSKPLFFAVGRLKPGITRDRAQANLATVAAALAREYPADEGRYIAVRPIREALFGSSAGSASQIQFAGAALLIVVGIVLLIACSNVANLLLARSAARRKEIAVRLAIGASRPRLVRQLLTESVLLGLLSGAVGLLIGYAGLQFLFSRLPSAANFIAPKLDASVFLFALVISLATGLLFGTIPALKATRADVGEVLKEESRSTGRTRGRVNFANALLVGQVAFSFVLLVTAALFLRSIRLAYEMDPGFQTEHLATFMTNPGQAGYAKPQAKAFFDDVRARALRTPGVVSASWSSGLPLWSRSVPGLRVEGREQRSRIDTVRSIVTTVDPAYFDASGIAIVAGRAFTPQDRDTSAPVAIVNAKFAADYWPSGALGKRVTLPGEKEPRQIVGVARTANYSTWGEAPQLCVYLPFEQHYSDSMTLFVRTRGNPHDVLLPIDREIREAGPGILATDRRTGREIVDGGLFQARMGVGLLTVFGFLALGLASIGLYGILAYSARQRRREIGLRMALGATPSSVRKLILKEGMTLVAAGLVIGAAVSLLAGRLVSRMLYGVTPGDPLSLAAAALVLSAIATIACYAPARSATRIDPLTALRDA